MKIRHVTFAAVMGLALAASPLHAQSTPGADSSPPAPTAGGNAPEAQDEAAMLKKLGAQFEGIGQVGSRAQIQIPQGYIFFPPAGAKEVLRSWGNLIGGNEDGLITHQEQGWSVVFEFDAVGYVKDDDKDQLDGEKMLKDMKSSEPDLNAARKEAGLPAQRTVGFAMPPKYNEQTNNLEWAIRFTIGDNPEELLNYHTKLLGRKGVMTATLLCDPQDLEKVQPEYQKLLAGFQFDGGETYAEYRKGDKIATYGLVGLVAGAAAVKMGLFSKLGVLFGKFAKVIILGVVAVGVAIKKLFGGLFGRRNNNTYQE